VGGPDGLRHLAEENARLKDQLYSLEGAMRELIEDHARDDELQRGRVELDDSDESDPNTQTTTPSLTLSLTTTLILPPSFPRNPGLQTRGPLPPRGLIAGCCSPRPAFLCLPPSFTSSTGN